MSYFNVSLIFALSTKSDNSIVYRLDLKFAWVERTRICPRYSRKDLITESMMLLYWRTVSLCSRGLPALAVCHWHSCQGFPLSQYLEESTKASLNIRTPMGLPWHTPTTFGKRKYLLSGCQASWFWECLSLFIGGIADIFFMLQIGDNQKRKKVHFRKRKKKIFLQHLL